MGRSLPVAHPPIIAPSGPLDPKIKTHKVIPPARHNGQMDLPDWVTSNVPEVLFPLEASLVDTLFAAFKQHCISTASGLGPDGEWVTRLTAYLEASATSDDDKTKIRAGRD